MIVDEFLARLEGQTASRTLCEVRVGLGYTAVQLDDGAFGLASPSPKKSEMDAQHWTGEALPAARSDLTFRCPGGRSRIHLARGQRGRRHASIWPGDTQDIRAAKSMRNPSVLRRGKDIDFYNCRSANPAEMVELCGTSNRGA